MTPIIWSPRALRDVQGIRDYIAQDSPRIADLVVARIVKAVERLQAHPQSGRKIPERKYSWIREVITAPYRVVYRVREDKVEIVTVFRASQLFPGKL